jgi:ABC-type nickel/cobalt efflux system permease component RcnA
MLGAPHRTLRAEFDTSIVRFHHLLAISGGYVRTVIHPVKVRVCELVSARVSLPAMIQSTGMHKKDESSRAHGYQACCEHRHQTDNLRGR